MTPEQILAKFNAAVDAGDEESARELKQLYLQVSAQQSQPAGPEDRGLGNAVRHGLQQSATFGSADEASALGRAALDPLMDWMTDVPDDMRGGDQSFMDRYRMYRDDERDEIAAGREHHGGAMMAAEFLPGLMQGGAGVAKAANNVGRSSLRGLMNPRGTIPAARQALESAAQRGLKETMWNAGKIGAGYGGLAGLGYGQSDLTEGDVGGAVGDVALGAGMGAGLGAALPAAGAGIKRGYQNIARRFGAEGGREAARRSAYNDIMIAMEKDRVDTAKINARLADDPQAMMMDMGPHLRQQAKLVARQPGTGGAAIKNVVQARQEGAPGRIKPALRGLMEDSDLGSGEHTIPGNFAQSEHAIMGRARDIAKREGLWDAAYRDDFDMPRSLKLFLGRDGKGNFKNAEAGRAHSVAVRNLNRRRQGGENIDTGLTARYTDEVMQALKGDINLGANPMSRVARTGRETTLMMNQHRNLMKDLKGAMPDEWHRARKLWAGEAANQEAFDAGKRIMTDHADDIAYGLKKMSQGEQDHYLVGALKQIEGMLSKGARTGDILRRLRGTEHGREVMRMLSGSEKKFQRFLNMADRELDYLRTHKKITGGSDTFENLTGNAQTMGGEAGTLAGIVLQQSKLLRGIAGIPLIGRSLGRRLAGNVAQRDEMKRDAMAEMLMSRSPEQLTTSMAQPPIPIPMPRASTALGLAGATQLPGLLDE